jgi:hypothetical protein
MVPMLCGGTVRWTLCVVLGHRSPSPRRSPRLPVPARQTGGAWEREECVASLAASHEAVTPVKTGVQGFRKAVCVTPPRGRLDSIACLRADTCLRQAKRLSACEHAQAGGRQAHRQAARAPLLRFSQSWVAGEACLMRIRRRKCSARYRVAQVRSPALIHHQCIIPVFTGTYLRRCLPVRCTQTGLRALLLAAYGPIRLSRRLSAPCIEYLAGDQERPEVADVSNQTGIGRWIWAGGSGLRRGSFACAR